MISFSAGLEYQLNQLLYTFVDIQSSIILSKSAESYRQIESPLSYAYAQSGTRELPISNTGLDQVKMLLLSANAGIGIQKRFILILYYLAKLLLIIHFILCYKMDMENGIIHLCVFHLVLKHHFDVKSN